MGTYWSRFDDCYNTDHYYLRVDEQSGSGKFDKRSSKRIKFIKNINKKDGIKAPDIINIKVLLLFVLQTVELILVCLRLFVGFMIII